MKKVEMTEDEAALRLMEILSRHVGQEKAIDMGELYERVYKEPYSHKINHTRALRSLVTKLRHKGVPIGSVSKRNAGGYYLARAGSELDAYCSRLRRRALNALLMESHLRKMAMPELLGQMQMNLK